MAHVFDVAIREASPEEPRTALDYGAGRSDPAVRRLLAAGDVTAVAASLLIALVLAGRPALGHRALWGVAALPLMVFLFKLYGLYDRDAKRISYSTVDDLPWLFHATVIGALIFWLYSKATPMHTLDYREILVFGIFTMATVTSARGALRRVAATTFRRERGLMVGTGALAGTLVRKLAAHPEYRLDMVGGVSLAAGEADCREAGLPLLGSLGELGVLAAAHEIDRVVFIGQDVDEHTLGDALRLCRQLSLKVSVLPSLSEVMGSAVEIDDVEGITLLGLNPPWLPRSSRVVKRMMDLLIASVMLIVLSPLLIILAIAVKLDSRGPVFFTQERVGKGGRRLRVIKFRTMTADAEHRRAELLAQSTDPNWLKLDHDPRITRLGRPMRLLSLDEIPQLWNVLRGEMSMVGPRPLIPSEDELVKGWLRGRLDLTPGLTGYWQVLGRTRIPFEEMVKLDYLYVTTWSLWQDIRLMLRTLPVVLGRHGAN
jgi:exopolysaccharide biosynthesis polyprenyl glycosylphosphotransferase